MLKPITITIATAKIRAESQRITHKYIYIDTNALTYTENHSQSHENVKNVNNLLCNKCELTEKPPSIIT